MVDDFVGWGIEAVGHIVRTRDGGSSWKDITPPQGAYDEGGFFALDANTAWVTPFQPACQTIDCHTAPATATIWRTTDGGKSWQPGQICLARECGGYARDPGEFYDPISIQFLNQQTGWLLVSIGQQTGRDNYILYRSTDGGSNWQAVTGEYAGPDLCGISGIAFLDATTGWMGAANCDAGQTRPNRQVVYRSADGGSSWTEIDLPAPADLPLELAQHEYSCGQDHLGLVPRNSIVMEISCKVLDGTRTDQGSAQYHFGYRSDDDGQTWRSFSAVGNEYFLNSSMGWRLATPKSGQPGVLQSTSDGGRTWSPLKPVGWPDARFDFTGERVGWVIAKSSAGTALLHTDDGGRSWEDLKPITAVAISPANASQITRVGVWPTGTINVLAFSPDWSSMASLAGDYTTLRLWHTGARKPYLLVPLTTDCGLRDRDTVIFSPDGALLAAGLCNGTVHIWRVADGALLRIMQGELAGDRAFSPDGSILVTLGSWGSTEVVRLWRVADGALLQTFPADFVNSVAFSPDGSALAFGSRAGLLIRRVADGSLLETLGTGDLTEAAVTFSPDGAILASTSEASGLQLWRVDDATLLRTLDSSAYTFILQKVAFSPDGALVASEQYANGAVTLRLWQVADGALLRTLPNINFPLSFSPDAAFLAAGSSNGIQVWGLAGP